MAAVVHRSGQVSPTNFGRPLERVFEDAQSTGEINLIGRKLKDFPKVANKYDLSDTSVADLSKNRLNEVPIEICECPSIERLVCYHNVIRCLPEALVQLQCLTYMNLSRNQLSTIPPFICHIQSLEILIVSNNKLVSLPEEIGQLERLTELDVSCNEITHLPMQIGDLESLRVLNVRKNFLVELPVEIGKLKLRKFDFSCNRISVIPPDFRKIETLDYLILDHNPLMSPPLNVCLKGRVHIMKYLQLEAIKEDRKRGILSDNDMRRNFRKSSSIHPTPDDFSRFTADSPIRLRNPDSGYNTTDSTEKVRWSPSEVNNILDDYTPYVPKAETVYERLNEVDETRPEELPPPPPELMPQQTTPGRYQPTFTPPAPRTPVTPHRDNPVQNGQPTPSPQNSWQAEVMDEFSRELQRQKADYEAKKKRAEALRRQQEEDDEKEREQRRRMAVRLQEEQQKLMERQRESPRKQMDDNSYTPPPNGNANNYNAVDGYSESQEVRRRPVTQSSSFRDRTSPLIPPSKVNYRRAASDSKFEKSSSVDRSADDTQSWNRNIQDNSSSQSPSPGINRTTNHNVQPEEEFRQRHETMRNIHQQEAQNVRKRLEEEKDRLYRLHKEPLYSYLNKKTGSEDETTPSRDPMSTSTSSTNSSLSNKPRSAFNIKLPEDLRYANPNFTVRRHLEQVREEMAQIENLRRDIETRIKVKLPEDLPSALKDGVVLCHLANSVRPRSVSSIHVPSPAVPTLSMAKCRRNVENFLEACRRIGVDEHQTCSAMDILEEKGTLRVAITVHALLNICNPNLSTV